MVELRFVHGGRLRRSTDGEKPCIEGYASVFDQQYDSGYFIETVKPGAFARALRDKQDVRCLFNHDANNLLGRTKNKTLRMEEDSEGLKFSCDVNADTHIGADVAAMIDRGDVDGCSFAFEVTKQTWRDEKGADGRMRYYRDIEEVDLFDVGPVTYPAYEGTSVSARSLWPAGVPKEICDHVPELRELEARRKTHTKKVDGENLTADSFLIVGDPEKTDTWHLPWKFSDEEKTKSHLRDALARFDQLQGVSDEQKKAAWSKLVKLCEEHGIDVSDDDKKKHGDADGDERAWRQAALFRLKTAALKARGIFIN